MGERRGTKALELWCRRITEGYPGVNVQNMTTSWKDGLAFCAMIHHFRPDLIDFDGLDKNNVYGNNELAFRIAEQHLGIPALLDAEDMASCSVPDRLSILTYLSQFYQTFGGTSPTRHPVTRTAESIEERIAQVPESPKEKEMYPAVRKDLCAVCRLPIFLAEKLVLARVAYHRTCFRCARCNNQLTLGNYYETEEGQYCCETCPDEEIPPSTIQNWDDSLTLGRTEKDEVDTSCKTSTSNDDSVNEGMFTYNPIQKLNHEDSPIPDLIAQTSRLRLNFISNQLLSEQSDNNSQTNENLSSSEEDGTNLEAERIKSVVQSVNDEYEKQKKEGKEHNCLVASLQLESHGSKGTVEAASGNFTNTKDHVHEQSNTDKHTSREELASPDIVKDKSVFRNDIKKIVEQIEQSTRAESSLSLVQQRRRIFEKENDYSEKNKNDGKNAGILKLKVQREEPKVTEAIENSVKDTNTVKPIIDQEDVCRSDSENSNATSLQMTSCEESSLDTWKASKNSSMTLSYKESSENRVYTDAVNDVIVKNTSANVKKEYPEDLNPFKSDEEEEIADKSEDLNPFGNEDEEEEEEDVIEKRGITPPKPAMRNNFNGNKTNEKLLMEGPTKRRLAAPQINLNPFWSDEDDHDSDIEPKEKTSEVTPVPKPRTLKYIQEINTQGPKSDQSYESLQISNSPIRSPESGISIGGTYKKKKPAPLPPNRKDSPAHSTPKTRKTKPAPPPPIPTTSNFEQTPTPTSKTDDANTEHNVWEDQKINKDEANRNRQSFTHVACEENFHYRAYLDKSVEGKWKRKKGPAPPCPIPHRRKIKVMSLKDVKVELDEIELQQQGLEKQGVRLEQLIRNKCESGSRANDVSLGTDVEELVLELFALVNEKNELFRRQAELMLLRRQQRLEEEHAEIEYQIRCLMSQHESTKTDFDKQREEALIQRLVEIVEKRNEIVDCLEMDRRREIEEDRSIHKHMDLFAAKNKNESSSNEMDTVEKKKRKQNKQKEKAKEKKLKKAFKKDIDKDVDEIELTLKRHTKRKWF